MRIRGRTRSRWSMVRTFASVGLPEEDSCTRSSAAARSTPRGTPSAAGRGAAPHEFLEFFSGLLLSAGTSRALESSGEVHHLLTPQGSKRLLATFRSDDGGKPSNDRASRCLAIGLDHVTSRPIGRRRQVVRNIFGFEPVDAYTSGPLDSRVVRSDLGRWRKTMLALFEAGEVTRWSRNRPVLRSASRRRPS